MKKDPEALYKKLHAISQHTAVLHSIESLVHWDQETFLPKAGINFRSKQIEALSHLLHKQHTSPTFQKALGSLINIESGEILYPTLSHRHIAALKRWRKDFLQAKRLPTSFVKKFSELASQASHVWAIAREENDFRKFSPYLKKIVDLSRKKADYLGYKDHPYDALLDLFEPEMYSSQLSELFGRLKIELTNLVREISQKKPVRTDFLKKNYAVDKQLQFSKTVLEKMGFEKNTYRLDESSHPFCSGLNSKDIRMTTHVFPDRFKSCLFSVLHEAGHGLYDANLPEKDFGSPLAEAISYGVHESQSRFWETIIGKGLPFWKHFYPLLREYFPENLHDASLEEFYKGINEVKPSLIRIEADEVTYCLHIILRFEIEKALMEGELAPKDIPDAWNEKMRTSLGIVPSNNAEGCLQDIHWSLGYFGYFPSYALGNLYAAQFFKTLKKDTPSWKEKLGEGDLVCIKDWLAQNIHKYGREFSSQELIQKITGKPVEERDYMDYLKEKYRGIYHLDGV